MKNKKKNTGKENTENVGHHKRPNLQIIVTDEEGSQVNGIGQVFNKVIKEN